MFEITVTRWSWSKSFLEVKALGVPIYAKEYEEDVSDNPEIAVELMNIVKQNNIDLSVPVIMYDYRRLNKERTRHLALSEIMDFATDYIKSKGH